MGGIYSTHGEMRNAYKILPGKPGSRPFARPRRGCDDRDMMMMMRRRRRNK